jgi:murein DD-endopeptidase MepM/ murein hydrolase activator NlpD/muramidase (phage lysozyme)
MEAKENGARLTELKAVFKNGIAKVKVKLRPESDDDLKVWRDKLSGVKDGTFTYTFGGNNDTSDKDKKASIAEAIVQNSKDELAKDKKFAKTDTVAAALSKSSYNKGDTVTFDAFKSVEELWWIHAKCTGKEEIEADFLKKDGKYFKIEKRKDIIFPLLVKPRNDIKGSNKGSYWAANKANQTNFGVSRGGGRLHAARDLETNPKETVIAICDGVVLEAKAFYLGTDQVTVHHKTKDGREFIVRYGELDSDSLKVKKGDAVYQKQPLGKTGKMTGITRFMIHFELYTGKEGFEVVNYRLSQDNNPPYYRRKDLIDPLDILQEGYRNTFEESVGESKWAHSDFGNLLAQHESGDNYNKCNKTKGGYEVINDITVVEQTIKEMQKRQSDRSVFAIGRYQLIPKTLSSAICSLGLDIEANMNEEMQDRIFDEYLIKIKRPKIIAYLEGSGSIEDAMYAAAMEWACVGVEKGKQISDKIEKDKDGNIISKTIRYAKGGESYYAGDGFNKASIAPDDLKKALENSKKKTINNLYNEKVNLGDNDNFICSFM